MAEKENSAHRSARLGRKRYPLETLYLTVSRKCNLSCIHCWVSACTSAVPTLEKIPTSRYVSVINQAMELGLRQVKITGGEPFAVEGISDLIRYVGTLGITTLIETNGTIMNSDLISILGKVEAELRIGFDGLHRTTYDLIRGKAEEFDKVIKNIGLLESAGIPFEIITVALRPNLSEISALAEWSIEKGAEKHRTNLTIQNIGRGTKVQNLSLNFQELKRLLQDLNEVGQKYRGRIFATKPRILEPAYVCSLQPCKWGTHLCGVNPEGMVSLCGADVMIAGDLERDSLKEIWEESPIFQECRSIRPIDLKGICGNCLEAETCRGMCRVNAFCAYGDLYAPYPLCQLFYEHDEFPRSYLTNPLKNSGYDKPKA
jgi:radical SAM protein with 4Fe4S-binding SPASM domain